MKNLPIDVLRTFTTIAQLGGFTLAGDILGRSQPAISLQIKRLEEQIGKPVFIRSGPTVELSETGKILLDYAERILRLNDEAISRLDSTAVSGSVSLGIPSEFATTLLPKIVGRFVRTHPNITLDVSCDLSKNLASEKGKKKYDLVLALHDNPKDAGNNHVKTDEMVWVASHNLLLTETDSISLIAAPEGCIYRKQATTKLKEFGKKWKIVYSVSDLTGIQSALEEGLGVTVLAKSTVPNSLKIIKPSTLFPPLDNIYISVLKLDPDHNEATEKMAEYLTSSLSSGPFIIGDQTAS